MLPLPVSWLPCVSKAFQFLYLIQSSLNIQICNISYPMKKGICQHKKEKHNTCRTLWNCHLLQIYFLKWINSFMNESHKQQLKILGVWTLRSWKSLKFNQLLTMDTDVLYHIIFILWFRGRMKGYHESSLEHIYKILTKSSTLVKVSELQELTDCNPENLNFRNWPEAANCCYHSFDWMSYHLTLKHLSGQNISQNGWQQLFQHCL